MVILAKEIIMIGPAARGARHDIILLGHQRTNNITPGKLSQPSYLTEIQIRLVSWYLRLRMFEKERCNTNRRNDIARFSGNELWKRVPNKGSSLHQGEVRRWLIDSATIHWDFQKMDFHNYVNKEITFVRSNDIRKYARGKHTQLNMGWKVRPKYGLGCTTNVRMVIQ